MEEVTQLGYHYTISWEVEKGLTYFKFAAGEDEPAAITSLGHTFWRGTLGQDENITRAEEFFNRAVALGYARAQLALAHILDQKKRQDPLYIQAHNISDSPRHYKAISRLPLRLEYAGVRAMSLLHETTRQGFGPGMYAYGLMYLTAKNTATYKNATAYPLIGFDMIIGLTSEFTPKKNCTTAIEYIQKAADRGVALARRIVGEAFITGRLCPPIEHQVDVLKIEPDPMYVTPSRLYIRQGVGMCTTSTGSNITHLATRLITATGITASVTTLGKCEAQCLSFGDCIGYAQLKLKRHTVGTKQKEKDYWSTSSPIFDVDGETHAVECMLYGHFAEDAALHVPPQNGVNTTGWEFFGGARTSISNSSLHKGWECYKVHAALQERCCRHPKEVPKGVEYTSLAAGQNDAVAAKQMKGTQQPADFPNRHDLFPKPPLESRPRVGPCESLGYVALHP